jgi:UDP-N-acetylglucosamine diphosphorylase/glucosamine-1-phosphate N-acetyltransferase
MEPPMTTNIAIALTTPLTQLLDGYTLGQHLQKIVIAAGGTPSREAAITIDARYPLLPVPVIRALISGDIQEVRDAAGEVVATNSNASSDALTLASAHAFRADLPFQAAQISAILQLERLSEMTERGVSFIDPKRVTIDRSVTIAEGVTIWPNVTILGGTTIGAGSTLHAGCWLQDTRVGANVVIKPNSVLDGATVGDECVIGPMAHLRPDSVLNNDVKVGNFVEVKKSTLQQGVRASHLSYIGDTTVGERTNIGAGTITCNYDGHQKHQTTIGSDAFIGSNTALIAPVSIGDNAVIGAGSTITKDVADEALAVERAATKRFPGKGRALQDRNRTRAKKGNADNE